MCAGYPWLPHEGSEGVLRTLVPTRPIPVAVRGADGACSGAACATGLEEALKRKDAIIRVRNAQISALWDELHTRQPWTNALAGEGPINLMAAEAQPANASRKLLVIGINTVRAAACMAPS